MPWAAGTETAAQRGLALESAFLCAVAAVSHSRAMLSALLARTMLPMFHPQQLLADACREQYQKERASLERPAPPTRHPLRCPLRALPGSALPRSATRHRSLVCD